MAKMILSAGGASDIMESEGLKLETYLDEAGIPTIGYGHTGPEVKMGQRIDMEQAQSYFRKDVAKFESGVSDLVKTPITQGQFDALVSFAYNVGLGAFAKSTLLKKLNAGDSAGAAAEFMKWTKAGGRVSRGLVARREKDRATFTGERIAGTKSQYGRAIALNETQEMITGSPQKIDGMTTPDQLMSINQQVVAQLSSIAQSLGEDAQNNLENERFLQELRKEGTGKV